ncbi:isocitrate lyase/phosphoenolpyruvate mutase family protein [Desulfobacterales bacterium HSG2]|nr:isocitrate lyase/phosphoenolpyruvate mutase family protein [Desulfobacterales bacterium HSG2]
MTKSEKLRKMFRKPGIIKLVGAHNGLTAKLVENAGFEGVWASSLEISASHLLPDANILTMTNYLNAAIAMNDAVDIPVVADVDQGYGNCNNVSRMVEKFEAAGIAGVIMEDNVFPKQNSLLEGERKELASARDFVGKIMAGKAAQRTKSFMLIARVEALIAGYGQKEAMRRAKAYVKAGADGIMIHSKKKDPSEIIEFVKAWDNGMPLVIVPTNYPSFTEERIKAYPGIKMVIYANFVVRTVVTAIQRSLSEIRESGGISTISSKLIPVKDLFELQGTFEMKDAEKIFQQKAYEIIRNIGPAARVPMDKKNMANWPVQSSLILPEGKHNDKLQGFRGHAGQMQN